MNAVYAHACWHFRWETDLLVRFFAFLVVCRGAFLAYSILHRVGIDRIWGRSICFRFIVQIILGSVAVCLGLQDAERENETR